MAWVMCDYGNVLKWNRVAKWVWRTATTWRVTDEPHVSRPNTVAPKSVMIQDIFPNEHD